MILYKDTVQYGKHQVASSSALFCLQREANKVEARKNIFAAAFLMDI